MITIGQRVERAIEDINKGAIEFALENICIALDVTSQRLYSKSRSHRDFYKRLLKEYSWLIELIGLPGLNLEESRFGNYPIRANNTPSFQDFIYHIVRCGLVHDTGVPENFKFVDSHIITLDQNLIELPVQLIWALLAIVVFCPVNNRELLTKSLNICICKQSLNINDCWGKVEIVAALYAQHKPIRVTLDIDAGRGYPMQFEFKH